MLETLLNGRYRIIRILGSGGFGQTYIAEAVEQPGQPYCVVKQFKPARQDSNFLQIARRLFDSEAKTLQRLGVHAQIPTLFATFEENHEFYLVQEYIEGQTLNDELLAVKRLGETAAIAMLRDVLEILTFVHHNQVIHRDIKPGNLIRRQQDGKFVLIDFGAVKEIQTQLTSLEPGQTNLTVGIGTQGYVPSEQLMGKPRYSSDLYALGMTAIQALTGLQPFQLPTDADTAEVIWQDQAAISPKLAAILSRMTRYHFSQRYQSADAVLQALDQPPEAILKPVTEAITITPVDLVAEHNGIVPTIADHPSLQPLLDAPQPLTGVVDQRRQRRFLGPISVGIASLVTSGLILGMRHLGWLQAPELALFDRMVQLSPDPGPDPHLLVVSITEADLQKHGFPLSDRVVTQIFQALQPLQPRVIGLDLLRGSPQPPGHDELQRELQAPNVVAIAKLGKGSTDLPAVPPPPTMPLDRIGFNDLVLDEDGVVRRNLMFADSQATTYYSFSLRLALKFLAQDGIKPKPTADNREVLQLEKAVFHPLDRSVGGYQTVDHQGYQVLLRYRSHSIARQVSLNDLLGGRLSPEWVKDKIVLIGTTAPSAKDLFFTPYSAIDRDNAKMAGVLVHAQLVSQILQAATGERSLFWFWADWVEGLWIVGWAVAGGTLAWYIRHPLLLTGSEIALLLVLSATSFALFQQGAWVPVAAPLLAVVVAGGIVVAYRAYYRDF